MTTDGVQLTTTTMTVAEAQAKIKELQQAGKTEEAEKLQQALTDAISGAKEAGIDTEDISISSEMGATFSTDLKTRTSDDAIKFSKYQEGGKEAANQNILEEYGYRDENGELLTKDEAKAKLKELKQEKKTLEKEQKALNKEAEKTLTTDTNREQRLAEISKRLLEIEKEQAALRVNAEKGGTVRGIRKAADQNVKNYDNVKEAESKTFFESKEEEKEYLKAHPEAKGTTEHLSNDDKKTLRAICSYLNVETDSLLNEDGTINAAKVQDMLVDFAGADENLNLDERSDLKDKTGASKSDIKSLYKKFGFGVETATKDKLKAAGIAAGTAGVLSILGSLKHTSSSYASDSASETASDTQVTSQRTSSGTVKVTATATATAEAFAECAATASAQALGVATAVALPIVAGVAAFLLTKGKTEEAFDGSQVNAVLNNLSLVKGNDNKAIVNKIQDLDLPDEVKAAILLADIGGEDASKANTAELMAAYEDMLKTKEVIDKIEVEVVDETEEVDETEPEPDPIRYEETETEVSTEFNVKHKSGMGPYQYAEALGVPEKYRREFINMFRDDNNMTTDGTTYNKTPKLRNEYTFKDGTTFKPGTQEEAQAKIDAYNPDTTTPSNVSHWSSVEGKPVATIVQKNGVWVWATTTDDHKEGEQVPNSVLKGHPTYIAWCEEHGITP